MHYVTIVTKVRGSYSALQIYFEWHKNYYSRTDAVVASLRSQRADRLVHQTTARTIPGGDMVSIDTYKSFLLCV